MKMKRKILALTFDDGPSPDTTADVLDILAEYRIPATFFLVGQNITPDTEPLLRKAVSLGCELGNHSFSHPDMTALSPYEMSVEIDETSKRIERITGKPTRFFRPPYIAVNEDMIRQIPLTFIGGYGINDYDQNLSVEARVSGITDLAADGRILVMHDSEGNSRTAEALRRIIPLLLV
ncbi:MAG: polysaccharide deacetylase family protein [Oscillospiraceae bacterium]|nr:polysaccharide deacetylase family protein [Oscillospiraceae bacterium]